MSALIGASAVVVAAVITGTFGLMVPRSPLHAPTAHAPTEAAELAASPITFGTFVETMTNPDLTDLQRRAFLDEHLDRRVEWEGWVSGVKPGERGDDARRYLLVLSPGGDMLQEASCWFSAGWGNDLLPLKAGQKVTVSGVLAGWNASGPRLVGCRLKRL